jgi:anti-anti-sigma factor
MNALSIEATAARPDRVTLTLRGVLDHETAPELRAAITGILNRGTARELLLDLGDVHGVDRAGAATLAVAARVSGQAHAALGLVRTSPAVAAALGLPPRPALAVPPRPGRQATTRHAP